MRTFTARYQTTCPSCREQIEVGDEARFTADDQVIHHGCSEGRVTGRMRRGEVCPRCFMEQSVSGSCACD